MLQTNLVLHCQQYYKRAGRGTSVKINGVLPKSSVGNGLPVCEVYVWSVGVECVCGEVVSVCVWSVGVECVCEQGVIQDFEIEGGNVAKKRSTVSIPC